MATAIPRHNVEALVVLQWDNLLQQGLSPTVMAVVLQDHPDYRAWRQQQHRRALTTERLIQRMQRATDRMLDGTLSPGEFRAIQTRYRKALRQTQTRESLPPSPLIAAAQIEVQWLRDHLCARDQVLTVRTRLHRIVERITISADHTVAIEWHTPPPIDDPDPILDQTIASYEGSGAFQ